MKNLYPAAPRSFFPLRPLAAMACLAGPLLVSAQLNVAVVNTPYTIDFDGTVAGVGNGTFNGTGFQPAPTAGRLDSDAWASTGWSNGNMTYGDTRVTTGTDFCRGTTAPGNNIVSTGGIYSMGGTGITGRALGFQPGATDFTPGNITLRVQNNTGFTLTRLDLSYVVYYRDDQGRSSAFNVRYSTDDVTYTDLPALDVVSPVGPAGTAWVANPRSTTIGGVSIPNGGYFYIRWRGLDVGGTGSWDEFALDNIVVTGRTDTQIVLLSNAGSVNETGGSTSISVSITNPHPTNATTVQLALTSGPAARIGNYSVQTLTFPGGSLASQSQAITLSDNGACDGNATFVFTLQNVAGGQGTPSIGGDPQYTLTMADDETSPISLLQGFDALPADTWPVTAGAGQISAATGGSDTPANQRVLTGPFSWQSNNGTKTLQLAAVSTQDWMGIVLSARVSSTALISSEGADVADSVAFYVSLNGAPFPADPDVRISGNSNSRWGYSTGIGIASTTAGTPINLAPAGSGNRTTDGYSTVHITIPNGTNTVALKVIARNNSANEVWNIDAIQLSGILCSPIYYSRGNGSQAAAIWSTSRTGSPAPGPVTFTKNASMVVQNTHTVTTTNNASIPVRDLAVESGGTLTLTGVGTLSVNGPSVLVNGTLNSADDRLRLLSPSAGTVTGTTALEWHDITLNGGGTAVTTPVVRVNGTLQLDNGTLDASATDVQLASTGTSTARLGPVAPTASYTGQLRMERYIPAGVTDWRLLCSPVQGRTIADWTDDFFTAGFPGSAYPNFQSPPGSGILWPSVRSYDETNPGPASSDGLVGPTNVNNPLTIGKGFAAWSGSNLNTTTAFTVDVRGIPQIANTPVTLPMTYTNTGVPAVDGLNLVGNPVPSPIDFSLISRGADVENFYYIYDPGSGQNAAWDEANGLGTGGTNGNIQSSQGFWLHATGSNLTTTVSEAAKVLEPINGGVFSQQLDDRPMVRLKLSTPASLFTDEALVHFINGTPATGAYDIHKFPFGHPEALFLSTQSTDGQDLTINAYGPLEGAMDVPVKVDVQADGEYTITLSDVGRLVGMSCLVLEDRHTGATTQVMEGASYTFQMTANEPAEPARFVLHLSAPVSVSTQDLLCAGSPQGAITVTGGGQGPWDYTVTNDLGTIMGQAAQQTIPMTVEGLPAGDYHVTVNSNTTCGQLMQTVHITSPAALDATATAESTTCTASADGSADLMVMGGTAPYIFTWSTGSHDEDLSDAPAGDHSVTILDGNGCTFTLGNVHVTAGSGPVAQFLASATELMVGDTLFVFNTGTYDASYTWSFGDGAESTENEPIHQYTLPGTYTVLLTVTDGDCTAQTEQPVVVSLATGVTEATTAAAVNAWSAGDRFVAQWQPGTARAVTADVLDATGRLVATEQGTGSTGRLSLPTSGLPNGVYFLRLRMDGSERVFRLPLSR